MVVFICSLLVVVCGLVVVWRGPRSSHRVVGTLLSSAGLVISMRFHPTQIRLAHARARDRAVCASVADELERWVRSPLLSPTGRVAMLLHASNPTRTVTPKTPQDDDDRVKAEEGRLLSALAASVAVACLPEECDFSGGPTLDLAFTDLRPPGTDIVPRVARQRASLEVAAMLRTGTCPPARARH